MWGPAQTQLRGRFELILSLEASRVNTQTPQATVWKSCLLQTYELEMGRERCSSWREGWLSVVNLWLLFPAMIVASLTKCRSCSTYGVLFEDFYLEALQKSHMLTFEIHFCLCVLPSLSSIELAAKVRNLPHLPRRQPAKGNLKKGFKIHIL